MSWSFTDSNVGVQFGSKSPYQACARIEERFCSIAGPSNIQYMYQKYTGKTQTEVNQPVHSQVEPQVSVVTGNQAKPRPGTDGPSAPCSLTRLNNLMVSPWRESPAWRLINEAH